MSENPGWALSEVLAVQRATIGELAVLLEQTLTSAFSMVEESGVRAVILMLTDMVYVYDELLGVTDD